MTSAQSNPVSADETRSLLESLHAESFGWARLCCRQDREEAESVLQTVYVRVLSDKAVFDGRSSFRTWLFGVIRLTALEGRRRRWLEILRLRGYHLQPKAKPAGPHQEMEATEASLALRRALGSLPRRQAEVIQLAFYHELTLAEAADIMGVSIGSARTHYERGKKKLKSLLEER